MTRILTTVLRGIGLLVTFVFLLGPLVLVFILSFSNDKFISFPPQSWGFAQFRTLVDSEIWTLPLQRSIIIGLIVAALTTVIGVSAVVGISRSRVPGRGIVMALALGPLIVPGVVYAVGAYQVFVKFGLAGTSLGFVLVHTVLAMPFVLLIVGAAITRVPADLELAAMSLGASKARALRDVTLRFLTPAIIASGLFAFSLSMNEVTVSNFIGSFDFTTLPVAIFASLRISVEPVVMAISSSLAAVSAILIVVSMILRGRLR